LRSKIVASDNESHKTRVKKYFSRYSPENNLYIIIFKKP